MNVSKNLAKATLLASGLVAAGIASADIAGWTGQGLVGYSSVSGNSESSSLNAAVELGKTYGQWEHAVGVEAFFARSKEDADSEKDTTAERYGADYKASRNLTAHDYVFGTLGYQKDLFGGINERFVEAIGYGRRLIKQPKHLLTGEIGVGARQEKFQDDSHNDEVIALLTGKYNWLFSETGNFYQNLGLETGDDNTYVESVTGVNAKLSTVLALGVSYTVKHNSGFEGAFGKHSDKYTAINLTYAIK